MQSINQVLRDTILLEGPNSRLEKEVLLAHALGKSRVYLHTWPERVIDKTTLLKFKEFVERRSQGEPIAYIIGYQGFMDLYLRVNSHVMIPRQDTETLVKTALSILPNKSINLLDLGTGSGGIALALGATRKRWNITATDLMYGALEIARQNLRTLQIKNVSILYSYWFNSLSGLRFDAIVSNPPYIAKNDIHLAKGDLRFEPVTALASGKDGLRDLKIIITNAPYYMKNGSYIILEHGYNQADPVCLLLEKAGFSQIRTYRDLAQKERISVGKLKC